MVAFLLPAPARAQDGNVTLEVKPSQVRLSSDSSGDILAVLSNGSTEPIKKVVLTLVVGSGVEAEPQTFARDKIRPGAAIAETFTLTASAIASLPTGGLVRADFVKPAAEGPNIESVVVTTFDIQAQETVALEKVAKVELASAGAVLDEFGDSTLVVKVSNLSNGPISVTGIEPRGRGILFKPDELAKALVLLPNHQTSLDLVMTLKKNQPVRAGDHLVKVMVDLEWGPDGAERTASVVSTQTIKSSVFGESDLAELAKVPSLLFLPGFMLLMTIVLITKITWFRLAKVGEALTSVTIFAFLTIVASGLVIAWYWVVSRRDLRIAYTFTDILQLSLWAIGLGVIVAFISRVAIAAWTAWSGFAETDCALTALRKLGRRQATLRLPTATIKSSGQRVLIYEQARSDTGAIVVGPPVCISYGDGDTALKERIDALRTKGRGIRKLRGILKRAAETGTLDVRWTANGGSTRQPSLRVLHKDDVTLTGGRDWLVEEC